MAPADLRGIRGTWFRAHLRAWARTRCRFLSSPTHSNRSSSSSWTTARCYRPCPTAFSSTSVWCGANGQTVSARKILVALLREIFGTVRALPWEGGTAEVLRFKGLSYRTRHLRTPGVPIVPGKEATEYQERTCFRKSTNGSPMCAAPISPQSVFPA